MVTAELKKIDLVRERPEYFHAGQKPNLVHLGPAQYITLAGGGEPTHTDGSETKFQAAIKRLYGVAYGLKAHCKAMGRDFKVPALQAVWLPYHTFGDQERDLLAVDATTWRWKLLIMVPDFIDAAAVEAAAGENRDSRTTDVRLETVDEGLCVQALHVGPYKEEHHTNHRLREFIARSGLRPCGLHHEIYLNDPNRTAPERLRVILRQPVRSAEEVSPCPDEW